MTTPPQGVQSAAAPRHGRGYWFGLGAALVLAAACRFTGLSWGLRHIPSTDERVFVANVWAMVTAHDWNQRYYLYPGLTFDLLYVPIALIHKAGDVTPRAFLVARGVLAGFSILSVALTCILGTRLGGGRTGLVAAFILAVAPLEVVTSHFFRPDVILEPFMLLALLSFRRLGPRLRGDTGAGLAIGAAAAVKYTGVLLVPSYIAARLLAPGPRLPRVLWAGGLSAVTLLALTPYALVNPRAFGAGVHTQWSYHYEAFQTPSHWGLMLQYLGTLVHEELGVVASVLAVLGAALAVREWRGWLPLLLLPCVAVGFFSTTGVHASRFLIPVGGAVAILAGKAVDRIMERSAAAGWLLALASVALPLRTSAEYAARFLHPLAMDRTVDWVEAHLPQGEILTLENHLGLGPPRYTLIFGIKKKPWENEAVARGVDLVIAPPTDDVGLGLREAFRADTELPEFEQALAVYAPAGRRVVPLQGARLAASEHPELLPALIDGSTSTFWRTEREQGPGCWIQVDLPAPRNVVRVDVTLKDHIGAPLDLWVSDDGGTFRRARVVEASNVSGDRPRQVLFMKPEPIRGLRLSPWQSFPSRWAVAEIQLFETESSGGAQRRP